MTVPRINEAAYLRLVRGQTKGPGASLMRLGLSVAAGGYRLGAGVRNLAFDRGWKTVQRAGVPVVSVGNLTLGGTGKTPMVEWLARWFRAHEVRVAILSRGYGQTEGLNDEGRVLEENLPDVPHLQGTDRAELARIAAEELESQALILDDGFQHRRLGRDLDVVLLDALDPFGGGRLFPRGLLREPVRSLRRAGVVVLSRADLIDVEQRKAIRTRAERSTGQPIRWLEARHAPLDVLDAEGRSYPLAPTLGVPIAAFCGIGNPEGFRKTLEQIGAPLVGFQAFPDHHPYHARDLADLAAWATTLGAELVLTTQKDLVKLRTQTLGPLPLRALRIGLDLMEGASVLDEALTPLLPT